MDIGGDLSANDNGAVVFIYDGANENEVPDDVTRIRVDPSVTIIPALAFEEHGNLQEVELPEGITTIGRQAFQCCKSLKRINFPSTLQVIGYEAFDICEKLEDIILPTGLRKLGKFAFYGCNSLKGINIPPNATMDEGVFLCCEGLACVTFCEGLQTIGERVLEKNYSLVSVKLPSTLQVIEK